MVQELRYHQQLVRDCSWHPYRANLATVSWDGSVVEWGPQEQSNRQRLPMASETDRIDDLY
jgi:hypothetical protein